MLWKELYFGPKNDDAFGHLPSEKYHLGHLPQFWDVV